MKIKFLFIFIILSFPVFSQTEDSLEFLLDFSADNLSVSEQRDDSEVMDYYESLIANPVNINTADEEQLLSIPFITPAEAKSIVGFRNLHGPFFSKAELYIIKDIPEEKLKRILPFVTHSIQQDKHTPGQLKSNLISRLRKKNLKYENNTAALNNYNSLRINYNDKIIAGFSTEKDDGEISYIDFYSGYVHLKDFYSFSSIVVGDFYIEEGEGLLLWSTGGIPKNSEVTNSVKKRRRGIVPKTGKNEMDFFRGAAIEKEINNLKFTGFFSYRYLDAAIDSSGNISRFIKDGYHRSITEIERKNSASVKTGGGTVLFSKEYINFGLNYYYSEFDRNFSGNRSKNGLSVSGSIIYDNISFFGEAAFINFSSALITGIHLFPSDGIEFITSYRNYSPDYMNMYGHGFAEKNGATQNESGVYTGLKIKIPFANIGFYFDQYKFPLPEDLEYNSRGGYDMLFNADLLLKKNLKINLRYKLDNRDDIINSELLRTPREKVRQNFRGEFGIDYKTARVRFRCEYVYSDIKNFRKEKGILFMQDLRLLLIKETLLSGRLSYFKTDSFESAIYLYDSGFPGLLESTPLYGEGLRMYAVLKLIPKKWFTLYFKYSETISVHPDQKNIPSFIIQTAINY